MNEEMKFTNLINQSIANGFSQYYSKNSGVSLAKKKSRDNFFMNTWREKPVIVENYIKEKSP